MEDDYVESVIADKEELHLTGSDGALFKVMGLIEIKRPSLSFNEEDDTDFGKSLNALQVIDHQKRNQRELILEKP